MRVLINAANLRVGGGVQVASSFMDELTALMQDTATVERYPWLREGLTIHASRQVLANLGDGTQEAFNIREHTKTLDLSALKGPNHDVSFSVFGPEYVPLPAHRHVVGFADITSLFPERIHLTGLSPLRSHLRRQVSKYRFARADAIIVETPTIADQLTERWGLPSERIHTVPNTVHSIFTKRQDWLTAPFRKQAGKYHALYVTSNYPHKNLAIISEVGDELDRMGLPTVFVLTLTTREWNALPASTRRHSTNVGPVSVRQLGPLYEKCDLAFFPSLLEAFSVTPLEALTTGTPLVASDRDFVRHISTTVPYLADPQDPTALAEGIRDALEVGRGPRTSRGKEIAENWPSARKRALSYLEIISTQLTRTGSEK